MSTRIRTTVLAGALILLVLGDWVNSQSCPCDVLCTADFDPVCATNGNETKTFSNLCAMNAENKCCDACYKVLRKGTCGPV